MLVVAPLTLPQTPATDNRRTVIKTGLSTATVVSRKALLSNRERDSSQGETFWAFQHAETPVQFVNRMP